jgi:predicted amidohydrolase YtcJ
VLDRDIFKVPPAELDAVRVDLTMLDGEPVYERTAP